MYVAYVKHENVTYDHMAIISIDVEKNPCPNGDWKKFGNVNKPFFLHNSNSSVSKAENLVEKLFS